MYLLEFRAEVNHEETTAMWLSSSEEPMIVAWVIIRATPLNWTMTAWMHDQVGWRPLPNRTEFIDFSERDLINDDSSFCLDILLAIDLLCHVFPFESCCQMYFFVCKRQAPGNDVQCWAKFSIVLVLVRWSIRMIRAKSYATMSKFVIVMSRNTAASFCDGFSFGSTKMMDASQYTVHGLN